MTDNREATCAERIRDHLSGREGDMQEMFGATDPVNAFYLPDEEAQDEKMAELHDYALGVSTYTVVRIDLSTGGPADWLEAKCCEGQHGCLEVERVTYHFADWFDHAEEEVQEESALWGYAEYVVEMVTCE